jgi:hypothetical protein
MDAQPTNAMQAVDSAGHVRRHARFCAQVAPPGPISPT